MIDHMFIEPFNQTQSKLNQRQIYVYFILGIAVMIDGVESTIERYLRKRTIDPFYGSLIYKAIKRVKESKSIKEYTDSQVCLSRKISFKLWKM